MQTKGNPRYLIVVLLEDVATAELDADLASYIRTHTYIDGRDTDKAKMWANIRLALPKTPLNQLQNLGIGADAANGSYPGFSGPSPYISSDDFGDAASGRGADGSDNGASGAGGSGGGLVSGAGGGAGGSDGNNQQDPPESQATEIDKNIDESDQPAAILKTSSNDQNHSKLSLKFSRFFSSSTECLVSELEDEAYVESII